MSWEVDVQAELRRHGLVATPAPGTAWLTERGHLNDVVQRNAPPEVIGQHLHIAFAHAQRRQGDDLETEPVEQVGAELAPLGQRRQVHPGHRAPGPHPTGEGAEIAVVGVLVFRMPVPLDAQTSTVPKLWRRDCSIDNMSLGRSR